MVSQMHAGQFCAGQFCAGQTKATCIHTEQVKKAGAFHFWLHRVTWNLSACCTMSSICMCPRSCKHTIVRLALSYCSGKTKTGEKNKYACAHVPGYTPLCDWLCRATQEKPKQTETNMHVPTFLYTHHCVTGCAVPFTKPKRKENTMLFGVDWKKLRYVGHPCRL